MKRIVITVFISMTTTFCFSQCEGTFRMNYSTSMNYDGVTFYIKGGTSSADYTPVINWALHQGWLKSGETMNKCVHVKGRKGNITVTIVMKDEFFQKSKDEQRSILIGLAEDMQSHELAGKKVTADAISMDRKHKGSSE